MSNPWVILTLAALFEVVWAASMKASLVAGHFGIGVLGFDIFFFSLEWTHTTVPFFFLKVEG